LTITPPLQSCMHAAPVRRLKCSNQASAVLQAGLSAGLLQGLAPVPSASATTTANASSNPNSQVLYTAPSVPSAQRSSMPVGTLPGHGQGQGQAQATYMALDQHGNLTSLTAQQHAALLAAQQQAGAAAAGGAAATAAAGSSGAVPAGLSAATLRIDPATGALTYAPLGASQQQQQQHQALAPAGASQVHAHQTQMSGGGGGSSSGGGHQLLTLATGETILIDAQGNPVAATGAVGGGAGAAGGLSHENLAALFGEQDSMSDWGGWGFAFPRLAGVAFPGQVSRSCGIRPLFAIGLKKE
jgi:hypothetical protein